MSDKESFKNLIDFCIDANSKEELSENGPELFKYLLTDYFFKTESAEKTMLNCFKKFKIPEFVENIKSLFDINIDDFETYVNGNTINDSLTGQVFLSSSYLKTFYSNHPPEFKSMPPDIQSELIEKIKEKNKLIIDAYKKLVADIEATKKRTVQKLVALLLKNLHKKYGTQFVDLNNDANTIIQEIFLNGDEIFTAKPNQVSDLNDDSKIKDLIKKFFKVKQFQEIQENSENFKNELKRFEKRAKFFNE